MTLALFLASIERAWYLDDLTAVYQRRLRCVSTAGHATALWLHLKRGFFSPFSFSLACIYGIMKTLWEMIGMWLELRAFVAGRAVGDRVEHGEGSRKRF